MDKYEYRIRAEEINSLIEQGEFSEALKIAETIDWRRVRSVVMLCKVSELYKMNRQYEESKEILLMANDIKPNSRKVIYSLCELSIKLEETVQAVEYYKQYIQIAPRDADRFILQYRLYEAQDVSLEERIAVLEEFKKRDYQEKWAYELAYLYHRIGLATRCVEECDELILWFVDGKYVIKAMELKMLHAPLTPSQQEKYNARFMEQQEAIALADETVEEEDNEPVPEPSMSISVKKVEPTKAKTTRISKLRVRKDPDSEEEIWEEETREPEADQIPEQIPQEELLSEEEDTEDEDIRIAPDAGRAPTIDLGGAIKNVIIPQRNTDELSRQAMEDALAYERAYQQAEAVRDASEEDEDADMKIAPDRRAAEPVEDEDMRIITPDADEIQVRTIDAGNRFDTMNLEEETTKYLAGEIVKLMAEEDMEATDATRALPMNSIFHDSIDTLEPHMISKAMEMAKEMNDKRLAEEAAQSVSDEQAGEQDDTAVNEEYPEGTVSDDLEEITYEEEVSEEEYPEEEYPEEEYPEEAVTEDLEEITYEEEASEEEYEQEYPEEEYPEEEYPEGEYPEEGVTEDLEEITYEEEEEASGEEYEQKYPEEEYPEEEYPGEEYPEEAVTEDLEDMAYEMDFWEEETSGDDLEEITYEEEIPEEEITEEVTQEEETKEEYPQEAVTEDLEEITYEEENPEEITEGPEVKPLVFSQSKPLPKEFIEAVQIVAMEAAKEAAAAAASAAAAAAAKEAASAVAQEAATQAAEVATQAARQAAMEAAHATADAIREIQPLPDESEEAEEAAAEIEEKEEAAPEQPMVEKQITGQLSFKDIIADWEDAKKANEEKHIEEMKQRVKEQTGPLFADFDAARASRGSDLDMLSPVLDVFHETEDLAQEVEQALNEEIQESEEVYYGADPEEEVSEEPVATAEEAEAGAPEASGIEEAEESEEGFEVAEAEEAVSVEEAEEASALADKPNSFNTAEINGLEDKLLSALEGQHYDTSNLQAEILQNILKEEEKAEEEPTDKPVAEEPMVESAVAAEPVNSAAVASSGATSAAEAVALAKALAKAEAMRNAREQESTTPAVETVPTAQPIAVAVEEPAEPAVAAEPASVVTAQPAEESVATAAEVPVAAEPAVAAEPDQEAAPETQVEEEGRLLTREEKDKLGSVASNKEMQQRFARAIDNVSLVPLTGNILLMGEKGTDAELTARDLLRIIGTDHPSVLEVMGAFTAEEISGKDIETTLFSLDRGSLIIEQAGDLSTDVCNRIFAKAQTLSSILLIFVDTPENMEKLYRSYPKLGDYFTNRVQIDVLDNDGLVKFAQAYANEKEYSIDEMGKLALYNRIEDKQRSDHAVTVDEVKQIVDEAIGKADKKSVGHLMDIVFAKRYDKEDMIVLREKDFME
ncbi:MAG: hypothetical protein K6E84_01745 [Lachnospiraceae bacterium]|nr:hypothetical protein [Lachnospiraceae bacterium]